MICFQTAIRVVMQHLGITALEYGGMAIDGLVAEWILGNNLNITIFE